MIDPKPSIYIETDYSDRVTFMRSKKDIMNLAENLRLTIIWPTYGITDSPHHYLIGPHHLILLLFSLLTILIKLLNLYQYTLFGNTLMAGSQPKAGSRQFVALALMSVHIKDTSFNKVNIPFAPLKGKMGSTMPSMRT